MASGSACVRAPAAPCSPRVAPRAAFGYRPDRRACARASPVLAPENRLRHAADFAAAMRGGHRAGTASIVVHVLHVAADSARHHEVPPRVGFAVSKQVGGSVVRHRVVRRLRHLTRELLPQVPPQTLVVVRALPASAAMSSEQLRPDLASAMRRALRRATPPAAAS